MVTDKETFNVALWWWYLEMKEWYFQYYFTPIELFYTYYIIMTQNATHGLVKNKYLLCETKFVYY